MDALTGIISNTLTFFNCLGPTVNIPVNSRHVCNTKGMGDPFKSTTPADAQGYSVDSTQASSVPECRISSGISLQNDPSSREGLHRPHIILISNKLG